LAELFIIKENIRKKSMKRFWTILQVFAILKVSVLKVSGLGFLQNYFVDDRNSYNNHYPVQDKLNG
jgi:hypothetical protein